MNIKDCINQVYRTLVSNASPDDEVKAVANFEEIEKELERLWKIEECAIKYINLPTLCFTVDYHTARKSLDEALAEIKAIGEIE